MTGERGLPAAAPGSRRERVLESALDTFARHGYQRTSMDDVARAASISRPGLYLYFASKQVLLRAAVEHALARDVAAAETLLDEADRPLRDRLAGALDLWAGQYTGRFATDLDGLLERDAQLLGDLPARYAARFESALVRALEASSLDLHGVTAPRLADVVLALAAGSKRRATSREDFRGRIDDGLRLLLR